MWARVERLEKWHKMKQDNRTEGTGNPVWQVCHLLCSGSSAPWWKPQSKSFSPTCVSSLLLFCGSSGRKRPGVLCQHWFWVSNLLLPVGTGGCSRVLAGKAELCSKLQIVQLCLEYLWNCRRRSELLVHRHIVQKFPLTSCGFFSFPSFILLQC